MEPSEDETLQKLLILREEGYAHFRDLDEEFHTAKIDVFMKLNTYLGKLKTEQSRYGPLRTTIFENLRNLRDLLNKHTAMDILDGTIDGQVLVFFETKFYNVVSLRDQDTITAKNEFYQALNRLKNVLYKMKKIHTGLNDVNNDVSARAKELDNMYEGMATSAAKTYNSKNKLTLLGWATDRIDAAKLTRFAQSKPRTPRNKVAPVSASPLRPSQSPMPSKSMASKSILSNIFKSSNRVVPVEDMPADKSFKSPTTGKSARRKPKTATNATRRTAAAQKTAPAKKRAPARKPAAKK